MKKLLVLFCLFVSVNIFSQTSLINVAKSDTIISGVEYIDTVYLRLTIFYADWKNNQMYFTYDILSSHHARLLSINLHINTINNITLEHDGTCYDFNCVAGAGFSEIAKWLKVPVNSIIFQTWNDQ